ncbi:MAG: peptide chain release factor N(5)-glutamine methyltransferase [Oscillatoriales cyanobacterium SM2_2_1]|nr:peptide chain release factor N(5)-glutamine methyltransferase [Oscillatoriales cyanobacterium SM2_2_1]
MEFWQWWDRAAAEAAVHCIPEYELEYLAQGLGLSRLDLKLRRPVPDTVPWQNLPNLWQQRVANRVPVQYLLGWCEWRDMRLKVTPAVLIPRPETELMIDLVADWVGLVATGIWVDLGTGSGAIALGLARVFGQMSVHAIDISGAALAVAQENITNFGLGDRITLHQGNWFTPLEPWRGQIAGIVANPPYIPTAMVSSLAPEVQHHEPHLALDGGVDGLSAIRHLIGAGQTLLKPQGYWLIEHMAGQAEPVRLLLQEAGYEAIASYRDWSGIERFTGAQTPASDRR